MTPVTLAEVEIALRRILIFFFPQPSEQTQYVEAIYDAVAGKCTAEVFERSVRLVAETMRSGKKPVPSEYLDNIRGIQSLSGNSKGECEKCGGYRMVVSRVVSELYNKSVEAMVPCPICRKGRS